MILSLFVDPPRPQDTASRLVPLYRGNSEFLNPEFFPIASSFHQTRIR